MPPLQLASLLNRPLAVHPIVSLAVIDHYNRVAKDTKKRVVGALLGEVIEGKLHATNCFGVPFEEDQKDVTVWYLDHNYLESMAFMYHKINKREKIIGWYSTGENIQPADLEINELFRRYTPRPVYLIVDISVPGPTEAGAAPKLAVPFQAHVAYDEPSYNKLFRRTFAHLPCSVAHFEAEEVGVEHLLRDIESLNTSTRGSKIADKVKALRVFENELGVIANYLSDVDSGKLPLNHKILTELQNILNLSPDMRRPDIVDAFNEEIGHSMFTVYIGSVTRAMCALDNLIKNRIQNATIEKAA